MSEMKQSKSKSEVNVTAEDDPHIAISDLYKSYADGDVVACEDITLDIPEDEFVVLVGPSGCGKTTTLRCIAGLERPDSGTIKIGDRDVTELKPKDRDIAFVFQDIALFPHKTVRKNISFGIDMKENASEEETNRRVEDAAELLGIEDLLDRRPSELSGGQQQRVSLGRAMVMEPEAFLLDEPFSALDANLRDQMRVEVKKLQRHLSKSMVFVTHDQEEAMTLGDRIVVMKDGRIQQVGTPYEIYNEPENRFVADFIGSPPTNFLEGHVQIQDDTLTVKTEMFSLSFSEVDITELGVEDGDSLQLGVRPELLNIVKDEGLFQASVSVIEPHGSQDAVYLKAAGSELRAITGQGAITHEEETVTVSIETDKVWLFGQDGTRLL